MASQTTILAPFRGIRYRADQSRDLSAFITPPYDIISPTMQEALHARHPHNFIRIELPEAKPDDREDDCQYTRAADALRDWLADGVLMREEEPCFYLLEQGFPLGAHTWRRRGLFALVRLPEPGEQYVLAHEGTLPGPKRDRLRLMRACRAMTSPIMAICEDPDSSFLRLLRGVSREPDAIATDDEGVRHRLWVVSGQRFMEAAATTVGAGPLFIADGHHRFETAVAYRDEMRRSRPSVADDAALNYTLMLITSARDEALRILPAHRLLSAMGPEGVAAVKAGADSWRFGVKRVSLTDPTALPDGLWLDDVLPGEELPPVCALYWPDGSYWLVTPSPMLTDSWASPGEQVPVNIVHRDILDPALAAIGDSRDGGGRATPRLDYSTDACRAVAAVNNGECDLAVLLRPTLVQDVLEVARAGRPMPGKSTYFYPKVPAGLVVSEASWTPL